MHPSSGSGVAVGARAQTMSRQQSCDVDLAAAAAQRLTLCGGGAACQEISCEHKMFTLYTNLHSGSNRGNEIPEGWVVEDGGRKLTRGVSVSCVFDFT